MIFLPGAPLRGFHELNHRGKLARGCLAQNKLGGVARSSHKWAMKGKQWKSSKMKNFQSFVELNSSSMKQRQRQLLSNHFSKLCSEALGSPHKDTI